MSKVRAQQKRLLCALGAAALLVLWATSLSAEEADRFKDVTVESTELRQGLYMLTGAGGNIAASIGADGTLIVDDQYAPLAERILGALNTLDGAAPKLIVNTHFHGDHSGSNSAFGTAGTIVAHANVRARLSGDEALTRAALPVVTFTDRLRLHFNDDAIDLIHMPAGHTDGDTIVWFRTANVVHLGDHYFKDTFPYIDLDSGGTVEGVIDNLETVLRLLPDDITVIPGHGEVASLDDLERTLHMLRTTYSAVRSALAEGKTVETITTDGLGEAWESWGQGFINEERWIATLARNAGTGPGSD